MPHMISASLVLMLPSVLVRLTQELGRLPKFADALSVVDIDLELSPRKGCKALGIRPRIFGNATRSRCTSSML